jgi:spore germination protein D
MAFLTAACGSNSGQQQSSSLSYNDARTMVLDVLKGDEAKKTIEQTTQKSQEQSMKLLTSGDGEHMQTAVKEVMTSAEGARLLNSTMTNPKFAAAFAKALEKNNAQLHKDLLKDPEYQRSLIQAFNTPDYQKLLTSVMSGPQFRQQMMSVIQESMQTPAFQVKLMDIFSRVIQEGTNPLTQAGGQQGGTGGKSKGAQSGGGSSESSDGGQSGGDGESDGGQKKKKKE